MKKHRNIASQRNARGAALAEGVGFLALLLPIAVFLLLIQTLLITYQNHVLFEMKAFHAAESGSRWAVQVSQWYTTPRQNFQIQQQTEAAIRKTLQSMNLPHETQAQNPHRYSDIEVTSETVSGKTLIVSKVTVVGLPAQSWIADYVPNIDRVVVTAASPMPYHRMPPVSVKIQSQSNAVIVPCYGIVTGWNAYGPPRITPADIVFRGNRFYTYRADCGVSPQYASITNEGYKTSGI